MVCLSTGGRASHLAISSLQSSMVFCMLFELYCCCLLTARLYIVPLADHKRKKGKNGSAI